MIQADLGELSRVFSNIVDIWKNKLKELYIARPNMKVWSHPVDRWVFYYHWSCEEWVRVISREVTQIFPLFLLLLTHDDMSSSVGHIFLLQIWLWHVRKDCRGKNVTNGQDHEERRINKQTNTLMTRYTGQMAPVQWRNSCWRKVNCNSCRREVGCNCCREAVSCKCCRRYSPLL
jgi:hypothetical protein